MPSGATLITRYLPGVCYERHMECRRCGSALDAAAYCVDVTCPFSDHPQDEAYMPEDAYDAYPAHRHPLEENDDPYLTAWVRGQPRP